VSKLTTDVLTYCIEASNQKSKYAYRKILFYKKALVRHDVKLRFTKWRLTFFNMPKCMNIGGTCTLHKNYNIAQLGDTAGEVEVQPFSP